MISISVVSHLQGELVKALLDDLAACIAPERIEVILTINVDENLPFAATDFRFPLRIVRNGTPKGFGANHNAAFAISRGWYFCVLNPDVRIGEDVFPLLIKVLEDQSIGVVGPLIVNSEGNIEDSARKFPTPASIFRKALSGSSGPEYVVDKELMYPDWIAGMFMVFRATVLKEVNGFDEDYFLYYEDVDLCWRLAARQLRTALLPAVRATHDARRASHRDLCHLRWHGASMLRFFAKRAFA